MREPKDTDILNIVLERPHAFKVGSVLLNIYPFTLGMSMLISGIVSSIGINTQLLETFPALEALRLVKTQRDSVCKAIAYTTMRGREEIHNTKLVKTRQRTIASLRDEDIATLLLVILRQPDYVKISKRLGVEQEGKRYADVIKHQRAKNKGSRAVMFGGASIYGSLIDLACERYGWSYDYTLWGISLINLQLMLADSIKTAYLDEQGEQDAVRINGDDKDKAWEQIKSMNWD